MQDKIIDLKVLKAYADNLVKLNNITKHSDYLIGNMEKITYRFGSFSIIKVINIPNHITLIEFKEHKSKFDEIHYTININELDKENLFLYLEQSYEEQTYIHEIYPYSIEKFLINNRRNNV